MRTETITQATHDNATDLDLDCYHLDDCRQCADMVQELETELEKAQEEIIWLSKTLHERTQQNQATSSAPTGTKVEDKK